MAKGLWVKFPAPETDYAGAHRSQDGKVVGILTPPGIDSLSGQQMPGRINVVTKDVGHNLVGIVGNEPCNVTVDPATTPFERASIPGDCPIERVRHLVEQPA